MSKQLLRQAPLFREATEEHLDWVLAHGELLCLPAGELLVQEGDAADYFYILLEGEIRVTKKVNGQETFLVNHQPGAYFGEVPILLGSSYIASERALAESRLLRLGQADFWQMLAKCPCSARGIMRTMAERVQSLEVVSQQHAKLMALGTLSAGLAHEINNPAAAGRRAAGQLNEAFQALQSQSILLSQCSLNIEQRDYLVTLQRDMMAHPTALALDTLEQSEREDALSEWLDQRGIQGGWNLAPILVSAGWKEAQLNEMASRVPETALAAALTWLTASLTVGEKASAIDQSLTRITDLVQAVKTYSFMDQAPMQEVDIHEGLDSTLTMLHHKLKQRSVTVIREYDPRLPRVCAYGSELNQVWTNLIDNAIDALESGGQITLRTTCENDMVLVQVRDNGPGIPTGVLAHIFDPFFTTKEVGKGTGLGLDICYRIVVNKHKGDIRVDSRPGDTCFEVRLPVAAGQPPPRK